MKKIISLGLLTILSVSLLGACSGSGNDKSESSNDTTTKQEKEPESKDFVAKGEYTVGKDIQPGSYYAVLTEFEYKNEEYKKDNNGYVDIYQISPKQESTSNKEKNTSTSESQNSTDKNEYHSYMLESIGAKQRVNLNSGDIIKLGDNYDPKSWKISFFNETDFKKYMDDSKSN